MDPSPASEPQGTMLFGCSDSGPSFEGVGGDSSRSDRESSSSSDSDRNRIEDDPDSRAASPSLRRRRRLQQDNSTPEPENNTAEQGGCEAAEVQGSEGGLGVESGDAVVANTGGYEANNASEMTDSAVLPVPSEPQPRAKRGSVRNSNNPRASRIESMRAAQLQHVEGSVCMSPSEIEREEVRAMVTEITDSLQGCEPNELKEVLALIAEIKCRQR